MVKSLVVVRDCQTVQCHSHTDIGTKAVSLTSRCRLNAVLYYLLAVLLNLL